VVIPLIKPTPPVPALWQRYLHESYEKNHFCNFGPAVQAFQDKIKNQLHLKHIPIICCNATLALEVVLLAAKLVDCDILLPSFTFAATALAVERVGSRPILVDSRSDTWHMDLLHAKKRLTKRTRAMIVVHPLGMVTDPQPFMDFAKEHGLELIFDSAAAFGATYPQYPSEEGDENPIYRPDITGLCEVYSYHITKSLGIGEGAAIVSGNADFLEKCRRVSNFGFNESAEVELLGTNAKMSDFQAAVGLAVMDTFDDVLRVRRNLASAYLQELDACWDVTFQCDKNELTQHTFPFFPIKFLSDSQKLIKHLNDAEIGYRQYYRPLHLHPRYAIKKRNKAKHFPVCNELAETIFCLPCHSSMTLNDVKIVANCIKEASGE
jgi:dTDP-4-amino-4,6-dideoxygalactose transaminase